MDSQLLCPVLLNIIQNDQNEENILRASIYLKNQVLSKVLDNELLCKEVYAVLSSEQSLLRNKRISSQLAICIGKILNKHSTNEQVSSVFESEILSKALAFIYTDSTKATHLFSLANTILIQLSSAKLNQFKFCTWPAEIIKSQSTDTNLLKAIIKLFLTILQYLNITTLINIADTLNGQLQQICNLSETLATPDILKYFKAFIKATFTLLNLVPLEKHNFNLFCSFIQSFYLIGFESPLNQTLSALYLNPNQTFASEVSTQAESILGYSLSFFKGLLENPQIWVSDLVFSDSDTKELQDIEAYLEQNYFTNERIQQMLKTIVTKYIIYTKEEFDVWTEDSLRFFIIMKSQSNEIKGNFLRDKSKGLIGGIRMRFESSFECFCLYIKEQLAANYAAQQQQEMNLQQQFEKEALLQILELRIENSDVDEVDPVQLRQYLNPELLVQNNYFVKARVISLLAKLSDFKQLQNQQIMQESLVTDIMAIFANNTESTNDLCLKMVCIEYMKNFYNNFQFASAKYLGLLTPVIQMCNQMILQTYTKNSEVLNEILDLYKLIVEKYAQLREAIPHIQEIVTFLKQIWDHFNSQTQLSNLQENKQTDDETILVFQSILRIMSHIVSTISFEDIEQAHSQSILEVSLFYSITSLKTKNILLCDYGIMLLLLTLRRISHSKIPQHHQLIQQHQVLLSDLFFTLPQVAEFDEEVGKYFILLEEIFLSFVTESLLGPDRLLPFLDEFKLKVISIFYEKVDSEQLIAAITNILRVITLVESREKGIGGTSLNKTICDYFKKVAEEKLSNESDFDDMNQHDQEFWSKISSGIVITLLLVNDFNQAQDLTHHLMSNQRFLQMILSQLSETESASILTFAAYALKLVSASKPHLNEDMISNSFSVFKNYVESEIENSLLSNSDTVRLNSDLLEFNDTEEDGLFFEITQRKLVEPWAKKDLVRNYCEKEVSLIKDIAQNI